MYMLDEDEEPPPTPPEGNPDNRPRRRPRFAIEIVIIVAIFVIVLLAFALAAWSMYYTARQLDGDFISPGAIHGGWSRWGDWSRCSVTCGVEGGGWQHRSRTCSDPYPDGGYYCRGVSRETQNCNDIPC